MTPRSAHIVAWRCEARRRGALVGEIEESIAAIDGEIFQDAYPAPLNAESENLLDPENRRWLTALLVPDHSSGKPTNAP